jgi:hypothetical protein
MPGQAGRSGRQRFLAPTNTVAFKCLAIDHDAVMRLAAARGVNSSAVMRDITHAGVTCPNLLARAVGALRLPSTTEDEREVVAVALTELYADLVLGRSLDAVADHEEDLGWINENLRVRLVQEEADERRLRADAAIRAALGLPRVLTTKEMIDQLADAVVNARACYDCNELGKQCPRCQQDVILDQLVRETDIQDAEDAASTAGRR